MYDKILEGFGLILCCGGVPLAGTSHMRKPQIHIVGQIHKMHGGYLCNRPRIEPRSAKNSHFSHFETGELKNGIVLEQYIFDGDDMR